MPTSDSTPDPAQAAGKESFADTPYSNPRYRNYVLGILTLAYTFNFVDRQLLSMLQESIKLDLHLSDTQLGLLTGFAFAMFYVTAGIPIARWADRGNRRNIITLAVGVWSLMTAVSGLAANYVHLLLARIGVGIGEAGGSPPAHSMISDMYPVEQRGTALSVYSVGINIGIMFGFLLGGVLNEFFGWRVAFFVVGTPGILLALWIRLQVAEPLRGWADKAKPQQQMPSISSVVRLCWQKKAIRYVCLGASFTSFAGYGGANWSAPFFIRSHDMGTAELGVWLAIGGGVIGGIGTFGAGYLADRLGSIDKRWYVWIPALAALIVTPAILLVYFVEGTYTALLIYFIPAGLLGCFVGPSVAIIHGMVEPRMRALASAILYLVINIIGLGLGPTLIGAVSDSLTAEYGNEALRYSLVSLTPVATTLAVLCFMMAARTVNADVIRHKN